MKRSNTERSSTGSKRYSNSTERPILLKEIHFQSHDYSIPVEIEDLKRRAELVHNANIQKQIDLNIKDEEIDKLNDEITSTIMSNYELERTMLSDLKKREIYEAEMQKIADYCNDLSGKFRDQKKTYREFQEAVGEFQKDYDDAYSFYTKKISDIEGENRKLTNRINELTNLFKSQNSEIQKKTISAYELKAESEMREKIYNEKSAKSNKRFVELRKKYNDLQNKMNDYQLNNGVKIKGQMVVLEEKVVSAEDEEKGKLGEINEKINEVERYNNELLDQIEALQKKLDDVTLANTKSTKATSMFSKSGKLNSVFDKMIKKGFESSMASGINSGGSTKYSNFYSYKNK